MEPHMYKILGVDEKHSGPASEELVCLWIAQGLINAQTPVQVEGSSEWKKLGEFPEFHDALTAGIVQDSLSPAVTLDETAPPPPTTEKTMAAVSLFLGLVSVCGGLFTGIPAIICGHKARKRAREKPAEFGGAGLALGGLVLGYLSLLYTAAWGALLVPTFIRTQEKTDSVACVNNLKQVNLGARLYSKYNGRVLPPDYLTMSNELGSPMILHCPRDADRPQANTWEQYTPASVSYEYLKPGAKEFEVLNQIVFRCPVHGHVCFGDGKVLQAGPKWSAFFDSF
jgi:hypothetical protein